MATLILRNIPIELLASCPQRTNIYLYNVFPQEVINLHREYDKKFSNDTILIDANLLFNADKNWLTSMVKDEIPNIQSQHFKLLNIKDIYQFNPFRDLILIRLKSRTYIHIKATYTEE